MFTQEDIDAVLAEAEDAVDTLSNNVGELTKAASSPKPAPTPVRQTSAPATVPMPAATPAPQPPPRIVSETERIQRILKLKVPLVVRLAKRHMSLREILQIMPGTILEFSRTVHEELDVMINNHQIGSGVAVKVKESFGIRITYIGDIRRRIQSLAG